MKKTELLNSEISYVVSRMGHTDLLAVTDCGLPIPADVKRIDIALKRGVPGFLETLAAILSELAVEEIIIAEEMEPMNPAVFKAVMGLFPNLKVTIITHAELKKEVRYCAACVRTGEASPYANILLRSGVKF